jgi:hypothetical protein
METWNHALGGVCAVLILITVYVFCKKDIKKLFVKKKVVEEEDDY